MSAQSHAQTQRTVRSIADAMIDLAFSGHTADAEGISLKTGLDYETIEAHKVDARAIATRESVRRGRAA